MEPSQHVVDAAMLPLLAIWRTCAGRRRSRDLDSIRNPWIGNELTVRLIEDHDAASGDPVQEPLQLLLADGCARRVVGVADHGHGGIRSAHKLGHLGQVMALVNQRDSHRLGVARSGKDRIGLVGPPGEHQLTGGTQQRAMIAIALAAGPDLLIADEPTTALDVTLQAQIMRLLERLRDELGMSLLLISHDLGVVAECADEVYVMYAGQVVEHADVRTLFLHPSHPYTQALLQTVRDLSSSSTVELSLVPDAPPALGSEHRGCPFASRCQHVFDRCLIEVPQLRIIGPTQQAASHLGELIADNGGHTDA